MNIKPLPALIEISIVVLVVACFLAIRFCNKPAVSTSSTIAEIQQRHLADSTRAALREQQLIDSAGKIGAQVHALADSMQRREDDLQAVIEANKKLIANYKTATYAVDTSATLVPADFINDCKDCFTKLEATTSAVEAYKNQANALQSLYIQQAVIDSAIIAELQAQKLKLNQDYNDMRIAAEVNARALTPKRQIKIGLAGQLSNVFLPNAVGPGIMYEDRKGRSIDAKAMFGNLQPTYVISVHAPLFSF